MKYFRNNIIKVQIVGYIYINNFTKIKIFYVKYFRNNIMKVQIVGYIYINNFTKIKIIL